MPYETVLLEIKQSVAKLTLNRPDKLNSFNRQLLLDIHSAMREVIEDGTARAKQLLMLGEKLPAEQAQEWGLIYKVADDEKLMDEAQALAKKLATGPTRTYAMIRELLRVAWQNELPAQVELERKTQSVAAQ